MPTFLKHLSNPQYKVIWQNGGIELAEAEMVVFIGYSLPAADFEMQQCPMLAGGSISTNYSNRADVMVFGT